MLSSLNVMYREVVLYLFLDWQTEKLELLIYSPEEKSQRSSLEKSFSH